MAMFNRFLYVYQRVIFCIFQQFGPRTKGTFWTGRLAALAKPGSGAWASWWVTRQIDGWIFGWVDRWCIYNYILYAIYIYVYIYICADYSAIRNIYLFVLNVHVLVEVHGGRVPPKFDGRRPDFPHWNCHDLGVLTIFKQSYICLTLQWHNHDGN